MTEPAESTQRPLDLRRLLASHWPAVLVGLTSFWLQALDLVPALRYQRDWAEAGEPWRLLSGNLVHLGWNHLWLNLAGLELIQALFGALLRPGQWWLLMLAASLGVGAGLWLWHPELRWYVGLSGSLHGLFAAGLVLEWRRSRATSGGLGAALILKLVWEQVAGALPGSEAAAGGPVIVDAHLYGALVGLLFGAWWLWRRGARAA